MIFKQQPLNLTYMRNFFTILISMSFVFQAWSAETPPCTVAPTSQEVFDSQWKFFDVNNDGDPYRFVWSAEYGALYTQNKTAPADDWIISPAVTLTAGKSYTITAKVQNLTTYSGDKQDFTVCCGLTQTPEAMTSEVIKETGFGRSSSPVEKKGSVSVDASGDYYIGLHLTSKGFMGNFAMYEFKVEEVIPLPGAVSGLQVTAAPLGELKASVSWAYPSLNTLGGTLTSLSGAKIYRSDSKTIPTDATPVHTISEGVIPGANGSWEDTSVPEAGVWYYKVIPFNAEGESTATATVVASDWIGPDSQVGNVTGLTATAVPDNEKAVTLTWTAPVGSHGGYVDPTLLKYRISRSENGATAIVLEEGWSGELPYTDSSITGLGSYVYEVGVIYNGSSQLGAAKSDAVVTGGTMYPPYINDLASKASLDLFTFFHTAGSRDWGYNATNKALNFWGNNSPGSSFAILPIFTLEAGKSYSVDFTTWVSRATSPKNLSIRVGTAPTEEGLSETVWAQTISSTFKGNVQTPFSVPADGTYYIAFVVTDSSDSNDIYVNGLSVTEVATAPLPVTEAKAEAAPEGELKVLLSWENPNKTTAGTDMPVVDRIEIRRGESLVETQRTLEGGNSGFYDDTTITEPGIYTYTITAFIADVASEPVTVTSEWVGPDTPKAPEEVSAVENTDGTHTVTFSAVTEGIHGGYINLGKLTYTVSRDGTVLDDKVKTSPYTDTDTQLPLKMYVYSVKAVNDTIEGEATDAAPVRGGEALALPYKPDFGTAEDFALWTFVNPEGKTLNWKYDAAKEALVASFTPDSAWAFTPPIIMAEGSCKVSFKATCNSARYPEDFCIYLTRNTDLARLDSVEMIGSFHVESVSYPAVTEVSFNVPATGRYHVGYLLPKYNWTLSLTQADIEQTYVDPTSVDAVTTGETLRYNRQTSEIIADTYGLTEVYSIQGVRIISSTERETNISALPTGVYVARHISADGQTSQIRFIR